MQLNAIDVLIILLSLGAVARGIQLGLVRQVGSTLGFIAGLFAGSWVGSAIISQQASANNQALGSLVVVLIGGLIGMGIGESLGVRAKRRVMANRTLDKIDGAGGSVVSIATVLLTVWLVASILVIGPTNGLQQAIRTSSIFSTLNSHLPPATTVLRSLNKLVDPNTFPQVFKGLEPDLGSANLPSIGSLDPVVAAARPSIVKIEGAGCGGIIDGSGFVYADGLVATNAHVIAGVRSPKVIDSNGIHNTQVVWFNADLDLAVLRTNNLAGKPLALDTTTKPTDTPGVVLGYPGGGGFTAQPAGVIKQFTAYGRDIYGKGTTTRSVYALRAKIIPGNSGGPVLGADGQVYGVVFATSTTYNTVGYALTGGQVIDDLAQAQRAQTTVSTGTCSE